MCLSKAIILTNDYFWNLINKQWSKVSLGSLVDGSQLFNSWKYSQHIGIVSHKHRFPIKLQSQGRVLVPTQEINDLIFLDINLSCKHQKLQIRFYIFREKIQPT